MIETQTIERTTGSDAAADPLAHVCDTCCPPFTRTLCGRPITDDDEDAGREEDCVVCASMAANDVRCARCGSECE